MGNTLPASSDPAVEDFLQQAVALKYLIRNQQGEYELPLEPVSRDIQKQGKNIDQLLAHLDGSPFEYYVYDCVKHSKRYAHPLSNVEPVGDAISFGEVDIICIDKKDKGLACISCKGSFAGANKLEHLESFVQRANHLGGIYSRKILCVASSSFPPIRTKGDPDFRQILADKCKSLKIEILIGPDIHKHFLQ